MRAPFFFSAFLALVLAASPLAARELVVIAHRDSAIATLSREQASHLFLGRVKLLPSGARVNVVEVEPLRELFYRRLVGRDIAEINAYWARLQFSGRTQPPLRVVDAAAATAVVVRDPDAIAFIEGAALDARTRVLLRLEP
ncbi:MAG: hypothetical protein ABTQ28_18910 [Thauera sp.]|jgi:hypothetical protein